MFRKGLILLVCLTVMSAMWSWATTTYSISTKINSIGTYAETDAQTGKLKYLPIVGGDIRVRAGAAQTYGIKYSNFTTSAVLDVVVTPKAGYKISALTATGGAVADLPAVGAKQIDALTVKVKKPAANTTGTAAYVVATFAPLSDTATVTKNWQLQVQNNTPGGAIKIQRATNADINYTTVGNPLVKSYADTTPVKVTVTPATGWNIDYLIVNGVKTFYKNDTIRVIDVDATTGSRIKNVIAGFQKKSLRVTTQTVTETVPTVGGGTVTRPKPNGIEPANPAVDTTGAVRLVVTPTGANNVVKGFAVTSGSYAKIEYFDRFLKPLATLAGHVGPVKVTISGITSDIVVDAQYGLDAKEAAQYSSCTQTCHKDTENVAQSVRDADTQWLASGHRTKNVDCVSCHQTMPGPVVAASVDRLTFNVTDAKAGTVGSNYCSKCHGASVNKFLASAHYTKPSGSMACTDCHAAGHNPAGNREACASCHGYVNEHTAENTAGKGCVECHDKHNPATITGTLGTPGAHPAVTLYTFEEIGMQMAGGQRVPVQVDASGKGMPYSPKQTCGTSNCHVKGGVDYTYDKISDHAFHSNEGRAEYQDSATGKFDATKSKPWVQSAAMVGKW